MKILAFVHFTFTVCALPFVTKTSGVWHELGRQYAKLASVFKEEMTTLPQHMFS